MAPVAEVTGQQSCRLDLLDVETLRFECQSSMTLTYVTMAAPHGYYGA